MDVVLGLLILFVGLPYLARRVSQARNQPWAGPQTRGMRRRSVNGPPARSPGKAAGRAARSAGSVVAHPGSGQIRARAKADAFTAWQQAFAADWVEQQRHARQNGTAATAAAARPTIRQRLRLTPYAPSATAPANGTQPAAQGNGGPPARQSPPPPAPPRPARPASSNGGTPVAAGTSTASAEKLIEGINEIHAHAAAGGIHAKREALAAMHEAAVRFAAMAQMVARTMSEPGSNYGNEITEPIAKGGQQFQGGAITIGEAEASLATLVNMTVGDLATSARQAPHHRELSENGSH